MSPHKSRKFKARQWAFENRAAVLATSQRYVESKKNGFDGPSYKLLWTLRARLHVALKRFGLSSAGLDIEKLLGLSLTDTCEYLASQYEIEFGAPLDWATHGTHFQLDHIVPCCFYNFRDPTSLPSCFHYSNLHAVPIGINKKKSGSLSAILPTDPSVFH